MASAFKRVAGYLGLMDEDEVDHGNNQFTERAPRLVRSTAKPLAKSNVELLPHAESNKVMDHIISLTPRTYSEARLIGIERVTPKVFLLTPPNVSVSVEDKNSAAQASFFNQS